MAARLLMPAIAPPLAIAPDDLQTLGQWSRSGSIRAALVERAKTLLPAAEGLPDTEIASQVGCSRPTVILWRHRYAQAGLDGLDDQPRPGPTPDRPRRPPGRDPGRHPHPTPQHLGVTHRSSRLLADQLGVSHDTVARVWAEHDLKPWRTGAFTFPTDPQPEAKARDVVGPYLHPPERAVVLCLDEQAQAQALSRTAPDLPLRPGSPQRRAHDDARHGTTTLFAALEVATGRVTDACSPTTATSGSWGSSSWWRGPTRGGCTWCSTTTAPTSIPRSGHGLTVTRGPPAPHPASAGWVNLVEAFFAIVTRQAIRRGSFPSVPDLVAAIRRFVDGWNQRCRPFVWVKDADDVMVKATRKRTSGTEH